ncbi:hypothetical protein EB796_003938 [Bugula neritina]|uniref:EGF-like domain-containing protein n=1 Tax=Bugula neritina TaxID=10212 RepID=A0A7J7KIM9_BUGNE|nr:hypothetical protein EB796_003938 [Bugula neritina]
MQFVYRYWQCRRMGRNIILQPRNCALGTAVSDFFLYGSANPCTERLNNPGVEKFFCRRKNFITGPPPCFNDYTSQGICKNGGRVVYTYSSCSCDCTGTGFADWDCSKRPEDLVGASPVISPDDPCPNGIPRTNWCQAATVNGQSPCLNNGQCKNECLDYTCICTPPFTAGRNCESFQCSENVECLNGGTCDRGPSGMNQTPVCICPPGTTGLMCEISTGF